MHLAKAIFQPPALFAIRRGVGQTIADLVFYVSQVLAMLPALPIAIPLPVLRARSGHPRYRDLHIRLSRRPPLSTDRLRERAREQQRSERGKGELHLRLLAKRQSKRQSCAAAIN
jgi:hypothetical protein